MLLIEELPCILIKENGFSLFEGNAVLLKVCARLLRIPIELDHTYIVFTCCGSVNLRYVLVMPSSTPLTVNDGFRRVSGGIISIRPVAHFALDLKCAIDCS